MIHKVIKRKKLLLGMFAACLLSITTPAQAQAQNFTQTDKVNASDRQVDDIFGSSSSISGNYAIVGAHREDGSTTNQGAAYIYEKNSSGDWIQKQKLTASDGTTGDEFGHAVSIDGDFAVVGAHQDKEDEFGNSPITDAGSAYIFKRNSNGTWIQIQKIVASNRAMFDQFGFNVDIDNGLIILGTHVDTRSVYVFKEQTNGTWLQEQKIVGPTPGQLGTEYYGTSVSIDGNLCIVGARAASEDVNGNNYLQQAGAAYIYERSTSGVWTLNQKIVANDRSANDRFGQDVSISGNKVVIGAPWEDHDENGNNFINGSGAAYIFERNISGVWNFKQKIVSSTRGNTNLFGTAVAIENNYIVVGANGGIPSQGGRAAYIFKKSGNTWSELQKLQPASPNTTNNFGISVDLSSEIFLVGDNAEEMDEVGANPIANAGAAYFFAPSCPEMEISFTTKTTLCDGEITVSATASVTGGTPPYTYYWSNDTHAATASNLGIGNHDVTVVDANGCTISGDLEINEENFTDINLTLVNSDCGRKDLDPFDAVLSFYTANLATAYKIYIEGPGVSYTLTVTDLYRFNLSDIPGVEPGQSYEVSVSAQIYGMWTEFGSPCEIFTAEYSNVDLKLLCEYCGKANFDLSNSIIYFDTRIDADEYHIRINGPGVSGYKIVVSGSDDHFYLAQIPGIQYNATYTIEVGAIVDGKWMGFGTPCDISTDGLPPIYLSRTSGKTIDNVANDLEINGPEPIGNLKVYPNPTDNNHTFVEYKSKVETISTTAVLSVSNIQGRELLNKTVAMNEGTLTFEISNELDLVKGIYLIRIQEGSETFTQKLIVQ